MRPSTSWLLVRGLGFLLAALLILAAVATIVGIVFAVVATVLSVVVSVVVLGVVMAAAYGLFVLLQGGSAAEREPEPERRRESPTDQELTRRLQERYVAGELDEAEFERRMDRLLRSGDRLDRREGVTTSFDWERESSRET